MRENRVASTLNERTKIEDFFLHVQRDVERVRVIALFSDVSRCSVELRRADKSTVTCICV